MESITIKDVARLCGVGVSTVSRAINNHPDINEETRTRIMEVIRQHNYIPNNSARNLKRTESKAIAVLIKGITNPFFSSMIKIFEQEIPKKKYSFFLHRVDENEDEVDVAVELAKEKKLMGIIFLGGFFSHSREKLEQLTVPFVLSTIAMTGEMTSQAYSSVSVDDREESRRIVDYLCSLGHRKIAILASSEDDSSIGRLRLEGYEKALRSRGIEPDPELYFYSSPQIEGYTMQNGYAVMKRALETNCDFTAVYAVSDSIAIGACKAIFESGRKIPEDYSVAGFDGLDMAHFYQPAITTLRQPVEEMAYATVRILFDLIRNKAPHQQVIFPGELVIGESTRAL